MGKIVDQVMSLVRNKPADDGGRRVVGRDDRLRTGFDQAPIGVAFAAASGDWLYANERFLRAVGYTLPELGRITFASITHDDDAKKEAALLKRLAAGEIESYRIEKRVMAKNGLYRRLDVLTDQPWRFAVYFLVVWRELGMGDVSETRLKSAITTIAASFELPKVPAADEVFDRSFLPAKADRVPPTVAP